MYLCIHKIVGHINKQSSWAASFFNGSAVQCITLSQLVGFYAASALLRFSFTTFVLHFVYKDVLFFGVFISLPGNYLFQITIILYNKSLWALSKIFKYESGGSVNNSFLTKLSTSVTSDILFSLWGLFSSATNTASKLLKYY